MTNHFTIAICLLGSSCVSLVHILWSTYLGLFLVSVDRKDIQLTRASKYMKRCGIYRWTLRNDIEKSSFNPLPSQQVEGCVTAFFTIRRYVCPHQAYDDSLGSPGVENPICSTRRIAKKTRYLSFHLFQVEPSRNILLLANIDHISFAQLALKI